MTEGIEHALSPIASRCIGQLQDSSTVVISHIRIHKNSCYYISGSAHVVCLHTSDVVSLISYARTSTTVMCYAYRQVYKHVTVAARAATICSNVHSMAKRPHKQLWSIPQHMLRHC